MPKGKTNKGVAKRVKVSKNGKIKRGRPGRRHLLSHKSSQRKRKLRKSGQVVASYAKSFRESLNN